MKHAREHEGNNAAAHLCPAARVSASRGWQAGRYQHDGPGGYSVVTITFDNKFSLFREKDVEYSFETSTTIGAMQAMDEQAEEIIDGGDPTSSVTLSVVQANPLSFTRPSSAVPTARTRQQQRQQQRQQRRLKA